MNEYTVVTRWVRNLQFVGTDGSGHSVVMDSPLGENTGMRPAELLMIALAGCTAMDVISILQKKRQKVVDFEVKITGQRRADHPRAWTHMHIECIVRGKGVDQAAVERAVELSTTKYCPVHATLKGKVEITHSIKIEEAEAR